MTVLFPSSVRWGEMRQAGVFVPEYKLKLQLPSRQTDFCEEADGLAWLHFVHWKKKFS